MRILLFAALLPAAVLLIFVYKKDSVEQEPIALIGKVFALGAASGIVAGIIETFVLELFESMLPAESVALLILEYFIGVALVEELCKYFSMNIVRKNPAFNYVFDGIVYGAAAALGFAALENVFYVLDGGLSVAVMRAIFAVPGHFSDGVTMGCFYGLARKYELQGDMGSARNFRILSLAVPVLEHGFYDCALSTEVDALVISALVVEVAFMAFALYLVNRTAKADEPFTRAGSE